MGNISDFVALSLNVLTESGPVTVAANAFTSVQAPYEQPAVGDAVTVTVEDTEWMVSGQPVFVGGGGGFYRVATKIDATTVELVNIGSSFNAIAATEIPTGSGVAPGGYEGGGGYGLITNTPFSGSVPPSTTAQELASRFVRAISGPAKVFVHVVLPAAVVQAAAGDVFFAIKLQLDGVDLSSKFDLRFGAFPSGQPDPANSFQTTLSGFGIVELPDTATHEITVVARTAANTTANVGFPGIDAQIYVMGNLNEVEASGG